jgi:exodeoxyribonuclease VIII
MNVMLDLETMGTSPNAAIIAIGAVQFDPIARTLGDTFYRVINLESAVRAGGEMEASTVMWWLQQSDDARKAICSGGLPHNQALIEFASWLVNFSDNVKMWGNGAGFDNVILAQAYRRADLPSPWKHWNDRCYRTLKSQHPNIKLARTGTHHNALDDAESQAIHALAILSIARAGGNHVSNA